MQNLIRNTLHFLRDEEGVVAIEYGLMAVFIALAIVVGAGLLGTGLNTLFTNIGTCFDANAGGTCPIAMPGA